MLKLSLSPLLCDVGTGAAFLAAILAAFLVPGAIDTSIGSLEPIRKNETIAVGGLVEKVDNSKTDFRSTATDSFSRWLSCA